jgi:hypothetical protein
VVFFEDVTSLEVQRTAIGVNVKIPSEIKLRWAEEKELAPMLTNLRATIFLKDSPLGKIEVGIARDDESYLATKIPETVRHPEFLWRDALAGLIFVEKNRATESPALELELYGELCYAVRCKRWFERDVILSNEVPALVRTTAFQRIRGRVELCYRPEAWRGMIEAVFDASRDNPLLMMQPLLPFLSGNRQP